MKNRKKLVSILAGIMAVVMILTMLLSLIPAAHAASSSEIQAQINALKNKQKELGKKRDELEAEIKANDDEIVQMVARKNVVEQEIGILYAEIANINQQISAYNLLIADKQDELDEAVFRYNDLSEKNKERVRTMEEEGELSYWAVLFKANSFSDLLDRLNMVEEIAAADQRRLNELRQAADAVAQAKAVLQLEKDELENTRLELAAAEAELEAKRQEATDLLQELIAKGADFEKLLHEAEGEADALNQNITDLEREYKEAKESEEEAYWAAYWATYVPPTEPPTEPPTKPTTSSNNTDATEPEETDPEETDSEASETETEAETTESGGEEPTEAPTEAPTEPEETKPTEPAPPTSSEGWIVPCSYIYISSPFGERESPTAGASSNHQGIDLAAPEGTPIKAVRSGTVTAARYGSSGGYQVVINHGDGFSSAYLHMTHYIVGAGQKVTQGQVIGYVGSTGISTGNHLHLEILYNGKRVNPAIYIPF